MAIDKELYERYKKLKAQGVNITLAELKAQSTAATTVQNAATPTTATTSAYEQPQVKYSGNIQQHQTLNQGYMSQFSSSFQSETIQTEKEEFHGNIKTAQTPQTQQTTKFGLIGYPLGHSLSTYIHSAGFESLGLDDFSYELLETSPENLVDRIKYIKYNGFGGFNVTIPLKLPVTVFLDEIDSTADDVGAVNTVVINSDKTLKGYNTDIMGFQSAIPKDIILNGKSAGVLGTGGAARAAIAGLIKLGIKNIKIFTRNIPNSADLIKYLENKYTDIEFNAYQIEHTRSLEDIDILVNCTPIGMKGRGADYTPVEEKELCTLPAGAIVYDVIYNPLKTVLIKLAQKHGYRTITGLDMLIYQAIEAQKIWTGQTPDFKDMKIAALENLIG